MRMKAISVSLATFVVVGLVSSGGVLRAAEAPKEKAPAAKPPAKAKPAPEAKPPAKEKPVAQPAAKDKPAPGPKPTAEKKPAPVSPKESVYFLSQVMPLTSRLGCNLSACHGSPTGKGGFDLSMFGAEPETLLPTVRDWISDRGERAEIVEFVQAFTEANAGMSEKMDKLIDASVEMSRRMLQIAVAKSSEALDPEPKE